ncbi:MAG: hypothetical protein QXS37_06580 [Candidatus Aenigmatarchaeota archaeon]
MKGWLNTLFLTLSLNILLTCSIQEKQENINTINIQTKHQIQKQYVADIIQEYCKITSYKNIPEETDSSPHVTASGRYPYEGSTAISRDLKNKYKLNFGDLVYVHSLKKWYIIEDVTAEKIKNTIDILIHQEHIKTHKSKVLFVKFKK